MKISPLHASLHPKAIKLPCRCLPLHLCLIHARGTRTLFYHLNKLFHFVAFTLSQGFQGIVTDIAHPTGQPANLARPVFHMRAKTDALYASLYPNMGPDSCVLFCHRLPVHRGFLFRSVLTIPTNGMINTRHNNTR